MSPLLTNVIEQGVQHNWSVSRGTTRGLDPMRKTRGSTMLEGASARIFSILLACLFFVAGRVLNGTTEEINVVVSTPDDSDELAEALLHDGSVKVNVDWRGRVLLLQPLVLGNGSCLSITGSEGAVIDGGGIFPLLTISGGSKLNLQNVSLQNGQAAGWGGAVFASGSSVWIDSCNFTGNAATYGGGESNQ